MNNKLDGLVQQWACTQRSAISGKPAECGHHICKRANEIVRYNTNNILPCTIKEHNLIHENKINDLEYIKGDVYDNLRQKANLGLKTYLFVNNLTKSEWLKIQETKLKEMINDSNNKY